MEIVRKYIRETYPFTMSMYRRHICIATRTINSVSVGRNGQASRGAAHLTANELYQLRHSACNVHVAI